MLKDISNSLKAVLYERVSAPLWGTYIISWCAYSWEALAKILFSSMSSDQKITYFSEYLTKDANIISILPNFTPAIRFDIFFIPLILAGSLVFIGPKVTSKINIYIEKSKDKAIKNRQKLEKDRLLTPEQSRRLRKELNEIHQEYEERLSFFDNRILEKDKILVEKESAKSEEIERITKSKEAEIETIRDTYQSEKSSNEKIIATLKNTNHQLQDENKRLDSLVLNHSNDNKNSKKIITTQKNEIKDLEDHLKNEINANVYKAEILYNLSSLITSNSLDNIEKQFREIIKKGSLKKEACIIIRNKIENISTYDQADQYFDNILIPNLSEFSLEDLWDIKHKSMENSQINKRRDFEKTMSFIEQRITFLSR